MLSTARCSAAGSIVLDPVGGRRGAAAGMRCAAPAPGTGTVASAAVVTGIGGTV